MARIREKNLDDGTVATIVEVLDGWNDRLSWEALITAFARRTGRRYTRQTLHRHERIRLAFTVRKKALSGRIEQPNEKCSPELQISFDRIARLEAENLRLAAENHNLLEQFARWAYNAHTRNLSIEFLNSVLPGVDREQSGRARPSESHATHEAARVSRVAALSRARKIR
jgi:hypothetical protein